MDYNGSTFTGEISASLPTNFKIPIKPQTMPADQSATMPQQQYQQTAVESFGSPLQPYSQHDAYQQYQAGYNPMAYYPTEYVSPVQPNFGKMSSFKSGLKRKPPPPDEIFSAVDQGLPVELRKLMLALSCELCSVKMNSTMSAKMHYEAKAHDKKVNAWLQEWSTKTGEPVPKREKLPEGPVGPDAFHCDVCDLALTSLQHASQHYLGKKHRLALAGRATPHGSGYYGPDGKWIRTQTKVAYDNSGRFNIGESFVHQQKPTEVVVAPGTEDVTAVVVANSSADEPETKTIGTTTGLDPNKYCELCNISVTSTQHMKLHLEGTKHAKKLKAIGAPLAISAPNDTILQSLDRKIIAKNNLVKRDNSIYRTPSGQFYCNPCNITLTTEILFNQHVDSKKHLKLVASANKAQA